MKQDQYQPSQDAVAAIKAELNAYETHRLAAFRNRKWFTGLALIPAGVVALTGLVMLFAAEPPPIGKDRLEFTYLLGLAVVLLFSGGMLLARRPSAKLQQSLRNRMLPALFGFVGEVDYAHATKPFTFEYMPRDALPGYDRAEFGDVVRGHYKWMRFELFELHLKTGTGGRTKSTFDGVVVSFEVPENFPGLLLVAPRLSEFKSFFRDLFAARLPVLDSGDAELDAGYEFRSDHPAAAAPLIKGTLRKALLEIREMWPGGSPRLALTSKIGFLLLSTRQDFFELPDVEYPAQYERHIEPMITELTMLLDTAALVRRAMAGKEGVDDEGGLLN